MKQINFLLILTILVCSTASCNAESFNCNQSAFANRLNVAGSTPESVAERANRDYASGSAGLIQDPLMNSALGGYYNMMQGATGNSYNAQEMQRQQADYVKQQMNKPAEEE